jgi:hypothetical protein
VLRSPFVCLASVPIEERAGGKSRLPFPLRTSVEQFLDPLKLFAASRAKQAAVLYHEVIVATISARCPSQLSARVAV